jgi:hypothetical protein
MFRQLFLFFWLDVVIIAEHGDLMNFALEPRVRAFDAITLRYSDLLSQVIFEIAASQVPVFDVFKSIVGPRSRRVVYNYSGALILRRNNISIDSYTT